MSPRKRKPPVKPEDRQQWLESSEHGQSPPKIAAAYGVDPRTVRKHLEIARQEKEVKEARSSVLRNALERHYSDLCRYAERIGESLGDRRVSLDAALTKVNETSPYESQIAVALRQHIPKSAIWKLLKQQTELLTEISKLSKELEKKIEADVSSDSWLLAELTNEEDGVIPGIVTALRAQSEQWVRGWASLNVKDNLKSNLIGDGFVGLMYGAYAMGKVRSTHVELVGDRITDWTARVRESEELKRLEKLSPDLERVRKQLREEVAVIVLRRVVPGRCRYCPL